MDLRENNLRGFDIRIPLGVQVGVCGVSGSRKSSLVVDTITLGLAKPKTNIPGSGVIRVQPGRHDTISGAPPAPSSPTRPALRSRHRACSSA